MSLGIGSLTGDFPTAMLARIFAHRLKTGCGWIFGRYMGLKRKR